MRPLLAAYIGLTCVATSIVVVAGLLLPLPALEWSWWGAACLFVAAVVTERLAVPVPTDSPDGSYIVSVATIPHMACALLLPAPLAAAVAGGGMLLDELRSRRSPERIIFNVASTAFTVGITALLASLLNLTGGGLGDGGAVEVLEFLLVAATYYGANALVLAGVGAIASQESFRTVLMANARFTAPAELVVTVIGGLEAFVWVKNPYWLLVGLCPAVISQLTLRYIAASNHKTSQLVALDRLGQDLSGTLTPEEVVNTLEAHLQSQRGIDGRFIHLADGSLERAQGLATGVAASGVALRLIAQVQTSGALVRVADAGSEQAWLDALEIGARSWVALPLRAGEIPIGYLGVVARPAHAFSDEDAQFFTLVGERVAAALENARRAAELSRMAYHDPLTGLPNRALLLDRLTQALPRARRRGGEVALLFLDLDNFKVINDSLGHEAGDVLLVEVTRRLQACVREEDTVARLGGDEFTILLENVAGEHEARHTADRIATAMRAMLSLNGHEVVVSTSMGIAVSGPGREHAEGLVRAADLAMYEAKAEGKARHAFFRPRMEQRAVERLEIESNLRRALERGEFRVHYQPIVRLTDGQVVELEALIRWEHPERGLIAPGAFIPVAEEAGLIVPIGQWVLETVCRQVRAWQDEFSDQVVPVASVNLSARQFQQQSLLADIQRAVRETGVDPTLLKLEITESAVMRDAEAATLTLRQLKALGLRLAIDDFGTGYSSLSYLKRFPVDTLKIDRSFVDGLGQDAQNTAIVRSIVALASTLNLSVTAEGIETPQQRAHLSALGCEMGQGYLFARPMPADDIVALLREATTDRHAPRAA